MNSSKTSLSLFSYAAVHFLIDFSCFYFLMGTFALYKYIGIGTAKGFLLYNVIAFGSQFLIGWLCDEHGCRYAGVIGVLFVMAGITLDILLPMLCRETLVMEEQYIAGIAYKDWLVVILVLLALGNACFHVAGGIDSLVHAGGKTWRCGIFVSTGVLGAAMGSYTGEGALIGKTTLLSALFVGLVVIWPYRKAGLSEAVKVDEPKGESRQLMVPAILCFVAIGIRGYVGAVQPVTFATVFLAAIAAFFGKAMGGFLADAYGGRVAGTLGLLAAACCFYAGNGSVLASVAGIVCFNVAMPVTYYALYACFRRHPGFACGVNCLGLLAGSCAAMLVPASGAEGKKIYVLITLLAAVLVAVSMPKKEQRDGLAGGMAEKEERPAV